MNGSGNEKIKPLKTYMPVSKELYDIIFQKDNAMFNAFNARELEKLKTILGKDLEVFQDNTVVRITNKPLRPSLIFSKKIMCSKESY